MDHNWITDELTSNVIQGKCRMWTTKDRRVCFCVWNAHLFERVRAFVLRWMRVRFALDGHSFCVGCAFVLRWMRVRFAFDAHSFCVGCVFVLRWTRVCFALEARLYYAGCAFVVCIVLAVAVAPGESTTCFPTHFSFLQILALGLHDSHHFLFGQGFPPENVLLGGPLLQGHLVLIRNGLITKAPLFILRIETRTVVGRAGIDTPTVASARVWSAACLSLYHFSTHKKTCCTYDAPFPYEYAQRRITMISLSQRTENTYRRTWQPL